MTYQAHDVDPMTLLIDGVSHGFAVQGETFVFLPMSFIPALKCAVQVQGMDADKDIADDKEAGDEIAILFA